MGSGIRSSGTRPSRRSSITHIDKNEYHKRDHELEGYYKRERDDETQKYRDSTYGKYVGGRRVVDYKEQMTGDKDGIIEYSELKPTRKTLKSYDRYGDDTEDRVYRGPIETDYKRRGRRATTYTEKRLLDKIQGTNRYESWDHPWKRRKAKTNKPVKKYTTTRKKTTTTVKRKRK